MAIFIQKWTYLQKSLYIWSENDTIGGKKLFFLIGTDTMGKNGKFHTENVPFENLSSRILESMEEKHMWTVLCMKYDLPEEQTLEQTSLDTLADIMETFYGDAPSVEKNRKKWLSHVASPETIRKDNEELCRKDIFHWCPSDMFSYFLSLRAGDGRAHSGHGKYKKEIEMDHPQKRNEKTNVLVADPKVNTTIDDIIRETGIGRKTFGKMSEDSIQMLVKPIMTYLHEISCIIDDDIDYDKKIDLIKSLTSEFRLITDEGKPIMGYPFLKNIPIDPLEFMRGFYFASQMDNYETRKEVREKHGLEMGGGECYAVDKERLMDFNISFRELASGEYDNWLLQSLSHKKRMELFEELGIVINRPVNTLANTFNELSDGAISVGRQEDGSYITSAYIREERGAGVSDDIAIVLASLLPPLYNDSSYLYNPRSAWISRFMGAHFTDMIDTIDKSTNIVLPCGLDEALGNTFNGLFQRIYTSPEVSEALGIGTIKETDDLIDKDTLLDYIAVSANLTDRDEVDNKYSSAIIHSSLRYFLKEDSDDASISGGPRTCTIRELIAWTQDFLTKRDMPAYEVLEKDSDGNLFRSDTLKVGFTSVPIKTVKHILSISAQLVLDPNMREYRIKKYFDRIFENN